MTDTSSVTPATEKARRVRLSVGRILILIGGLIVAVSTFVNWGKAVPPKPAKNAYREAAGILLDHKFTSGLGLGFVLLVVAIVVIVSAFVPAGRILGILFGAIAGAMGFLFVYQVHLAILDQKGHLPAGQQLPSLSKLVGAGPYVAAAGGAIAVIGGVIELIPRSFWASLTSPAEEEPEEPGTGVPSEGKEPSS